MPVAQQHYMPLYPIDRFCSAAHTTIATLTATTRKAGWIVSVPPGGGIDTVGLVVNANTGSASFRVSLQDLSGRFTPSGTIKTGLGAANQLYQDVATGYATGSMLSISLKDRYLNSSSTLPATLAVVFDFSTGNSWAAGVHADPRYGCTRFAPANTAVPQVINNVGSWAHTATVFPVLVLYDSVQQLYVPNLCSATQATSISPTTLSGGGSEEYGNRWDVKFAATVAGVRVGIQGNTSGGNFDMNIWKNDVLVSSVSWADATYSGGVASQGIVDLPCQPFNVVPGDVVYMLLNGTGGANGPTLFYLSFDSDTYRKIMFDNFGTFLKGTLGSYATSGASTGVLRDTNNGVAVTDDATKVYPIVPLLSSVNTLPYQPNILG